MFTKEKEARELQGRQRNESFHRAARRELSRYTLTYDSLSDQLKRI